MNEHLFRRGDRTNNSYGRHDETWFEFLDRVDDVVFERVRTLMNEWFNEIQAEKAARLRQDFLSGRDVQVEAAFLELLLHAALVRTPLKVEMEPGRSAGRQPDFRCCPSGQEDAEFLVEARIVGDPPSRRAGEKRLKKAFDDVNRAAPQGFNVWVSTIQEGGTEPGGAQLRRQILPWLAELDREAVRAALENHGPQHIPERDVTVGDWIFGVRAWPWSDEALANEHRRLIGVEPVRTAYGGSTREFALALTSKKGRYELRGRPYVIALGNTHSFQDGDDPLDVLYGEEAVQISFEHDEPRVAGVIRKPNGLFRPDRNRRVSAVLHIPRLAPWMVGNLVPELWLNPFAANPLPIALPWAADVTLTDGEIVRHSPEQRLRAVFGLPDDWPGPEEPFERRPRGALPSRRRLR